MKSRASVRGEEVAESVKGEPQTASDHPLTPPTPRHVSSSIHQFPSSSRGSAHLAMLVFDCARSLSPSSTSRLLGHSAHGGPSRCQSSPSLQPRPRLILTLETDWKPSRRALTMAVSCPGSVPPARRLSRLALLFCCRPPCSHRPSGKLSRSSVQSLSA